MSRDADGWLERDVAERKVLTNAMEEGYLRELLPASEAITKDGAQQDYPELSLNEARQTLERLIATGLVGTYLLTSEEEWIGEAALSSIARAEAWTSADSGGLCLFLTPDGQRALGIHDH